MSARLAAIVNDVLEQDARDSHTAVRRGDVKVADRPGGAERQRRRHHRCGDESAGPAERRAAVIIITCRVT